MYITGQYKMIYNKSKSTETINFTTQLLTYICTMCLFLQISATMEKFEGMFEDLDVNTQVKLKSFVLSVLYFYFSTVMYIQGAI